MFIELLEKLEKHIFHIRNVSLKANSLSTNLIIASIKYATQWCSFRILNSLIYTGVRYPNTQNKKFYIDENFSCVNFDIPVTVCYACIE